MNSLALQALGIGLAMNAAVGCLLYERLVPRLSYGGTTVLMLAQYFACLLASGYFDGSIRDDLRTIYTDRQCWWWAVAYMLTCGFASILWYQITKGHGVLASSVFEAKYVAILAVAYLICGDRKLSWEVVTGLGLAVASLYFISVAPAKV